MKKILHILGILMLGPVTYSCANNPVIAIDRLRCQMQDSPVGVDNANPFLSWELVSDGRDVVQESYRIVVSSDLKAIGKNKGDVWDSGWVDSAETIYIPYEGARLESGTDYYWKVRVKTNKGTSPWSAAGRWTTGLTDPSEWKAKWTGLDRSFEGDVLSGRTRLAARYFRKDIMLSKPVSKAMLYISGLGLYEAYINGERIGTQVLSPTPTDYHKSVKYNTFEVTDILVSGQNALGVTLGNGRYFNVRDANHYGYPKMLLQMEVVYKDGTKETIVSDDTWKVTAEGPIRANNEFDGEEYDARMEIPGWNRAGYDDKGWLQAELVDAPKGRVEAQTNPNIEIMEELRPARITEIRPGTYILDMGQNMVGWLSMKVRGKAGETVTLRFAELLDEEGEIYVANLRSAHSTDKYTLKGDGEEVWEPSFTYHGFRFVEITGFPGKPKVENFTGKVVYDLMETTGKFETSNETINRIFKNAYWGIRGNYRGMPTDCPQRDEKMGWLGDRSAGSLGESFIFGNNLLYEKWLADIEETQLDSGSISDVAPNYWMVYNDDVVWPSSYIIIADMLHNQFGNRQPIEKHYKSMKKWMNYMRDRYMVDYIMPRDSYGDWCMPPESPEMIHSEDPARKTDGAVLGTSFYYRLLVLMEKFATMLGFEEDASQYQALAAKMKEAYNDRFFDPETARYSNNTVTANVLSLALGLVPEGKEDAVFANVVEKTMGEFKGHVSTGLVGMQYMMRTLSKHGRDDIAYRLATNRDYPSWGYMAECGATTIWELWNGNTADPAMNSANHVMLLGDLITWYYEHLAGIQNTPGSTGFRHITMRPVPVDGLDFVRASYNSVRGPIESSWKKSDGNFDWDITIPANTSATVYIPMDNPASVTEGGRAISDSEGIRYIGEIEGAVIMEVGSGKYSFSAALPK